MFEKTRPVEIADGVYLVGASEVFDNLQCNSYLIVEENQGVLIDPGSVLDFKYVYQNVSKVIDPHNITHFILHHQDPDLCSAVPLFEKKGIIREVVTHWRTRVIVQYYNIQSSYYLVNQNNYLLHLKSGRKLSFVMTPYLHFPGAMVTYDEKTKTLFSSDLFGAFKLNNESDSDYAEADYIERMKAFHEHYMPGNELIRPVMEVLLSMSIETIASQHGAVINHDIPVYIRGLRDLECGSFLHPIRKELAQSGGYLTICNEVIRRCHALAGVNETSTVFEGTDIVIDADTGFIIDFSTNGEELWNNLFGIIEQRKGASWLSALEAFAKKLAAQYDIRMPLVYDSIVADITRQAQESDRQFRMVQEHNQRLMRNIKETQEQLLRDETSGLYNASFFIRYLENECNKNCNESGALILASLDNIQRINLKYGTIQGDATVKNVAWFVNEQKTEQMIAARLEGAVIGVFIPGGSMTETMQWAEKFRTLIAKSTIFIEPCSVSVGVSHISEIPATMDTTSEKVQFLHKTSSIRLRISQKRGGDYVCNESVFHHGIDTDVKVGKVLVVDSEKVNVDILSTVLKQMDFMVQSAGDGEQALSIVESFLPDIIITELMIPKLDGFALRELLMKTSQIKIKPYIVMSHVKDEKNVLRAHDLGILHYLKKPYLLSELVGIVKNLMRSNWAE